MQNCCVCFDNGDCMSEPRDLRLEADVYGGSGKQS